MARQKLLLRLAFVSALVGSDRTLAFRPPCHAGGDIILPSGTALAGGSAVVPPTAVAVVRGGGGPTASSSSLGMAPRFDKSSQKWFVTDSELEGPSAGYGIVGSLYRAGPVPFIQRIVNAESYEQAVLKYMAQEGCDRIEAQGNMDAYLENPQDWAYQKMQEKNNGVPKKDYANANMQPGQVILSTLWASVVVVFAYDLVTGVAEGRYGRVEGSPPTDLLHGNLWSLPF